MTTEDIGEFEETKDPADVVDYVFDWSDRLEDAETISSYSLAITGAVDIDSDAQAGAEITLMTSGGRAGSFSTVTCTVTTSAGRTLQRSRRIVVENK